MHCINSKTIQTKQHHMSVLFPHVHRHFTPSNPIFPPPCCSVHAMFKHLTSRNHKFPFFMKCVHCTVFRPVQSVWTIYKNIVDWIFSTFLLSVGDSTWVIQASVTFKMAFISFPTDVCLGRTVKSWLELTHLTFPFTQTCLWWKPWNTWSSTKIAQSHWYAGQTQPNEPLHQAVPSSG